MSKNGSDYRAVLSSFNGEYMDLINGNKEIVLHNQTDSTLNKISNNTNKLNVLTKSLKDKMGFAESICGISITLLTLGIILVSISQLQKIESQMLLVSVVALMSSFGPVIALSALPNNLNQTFASANRVFDLLSETPQVDDIIDGTDFDFENLEIKNLAFKYNEETVHSDVNLKVSIGEIAALVGVSGCGKSTVLKLLLRFWRKDSGSILYNNIDIEKINLLL